VVLNSIHENEAHSDDELFEGAQDDASEAVIYHIMESKKWEDIVKWKGLLQGNFMEQSSNSVLILYQIPTPEDIK